jgi:hypothetical protein
LIIDNHGFLRRHTIPVDVALLSTPKFTCSAFRKRLPCRTAQNWSCGRTPVVPINICCKPCNKVSIAATLKVNKVEGNAFVLV